MTEQAWDRGLQPERTSLAWRRFGLSVIGISLALPRLAWPALGAWGLAPGACGLVLGVVMLHQSVHRYRRTHTALTTPSDDDLRRDLPSGRTLLLATCTALLLGATALAAVLLW